MLVIQVTDKPVPETGFASPQTNQGIAHGGKFMDYHTNGGGFPSSPVSHI